MCVCICYMLLTHLTETWRRAIDSKLVVGVVFIEFRKAFDCISHKILIHKLENNFGVKGKLLDWLKDYLTERKQFITVNGKQSDYAEVTYGIPQGSVLGPTLFTRYSSDLPDAVDSGTVHLYADDTTLYGIAKTIDEVTYLLNKALSELMEWCQLNLLTPHPTKCEAMIMTRGNMIGPLNSLKLGSLHIKWVIHSRLLGVTIECKLTWELHILETKKGFANKLNMIKCSQFLPRQMLLDLYLRSFYHP